MSWRRKSFDRKEKRTTGRRWVNMRHVVLVEEPVCKICGRKPSNEVDHIIPLCKGGTDRRDNLQGICVDCHNAKTAKDLGIRPARPIGLDGYPLPCRNSLSSNDMPGGVEK
jgi:5-methylcytosine-specific restriction protein A